MENEQDMPCCWTEGDALSFNGAECSEFLLLARPKDGAVSKLDEQVCP